MKNPENFLDSRLHLVKLGKNSNKPSRKINNFQIGKIFTYKSPYDFVSHWFFLESVNTEHQKRSCLEHIYSTNPPVENQSTTSLHQQKDNLSHIHHNSIPRKLFFTKHPLVFHQELNSKLHTPFYAKRPRAKEKSSNLKASYQSISLVFPFCLLVVGPNNGPPTLPEIHIKSPRCASRFPPSKLCAVACSACPCARRNPNNSPEATTAKVLFQEHQNGYFNLTCIC